MNSSRMKKILNPISKILNRIETTSHMSIDTNPVMNNDTNASSVHKHSMEKGRDHLRFRDFVLIVSNSASMFIFCFREFYARCKR